MTPSASAMTTVGMGSPVVPSALTWVRSRPSCSWAARVPSLGAVRIPSCHAGRLAGCGQVALLDRESLGDIGRQLADRGAVMACYLLGDRGFSVHGMLPPRTGELLATTFLRCRAGAST